MKRRMARVLAMVMAVVLMGTSTNVTAFAAGICDHHLEHTVGCGYVEAVEGADCTHEHDDECYSEVVECVHEHDENCGYVQAQEGTPCSFVCDVCEAEVSDEDDEDAVCICEDKCMSDAVNEECPVCFAENADLNNCIGEVEEAENAEDEAVTAIRERIAALPAPSEAEDMTETEKDALMEDLLAIVDELDILLDAEKITMEEYEELWMIVDAINSVLINDAAVVYDSGIQVAIGTSSGGKVELSAATPYYDSNMQIAVAEKPSGGYAYLNVSASPVELTLDNFNLDGGYFPIGGYHAIGIYVTGSNNLTLILEGTNILNVGEINDGTSRYAFYIETGDVTVKGSGTLTITAGDASNVGALKIMGGSLTVESGEIKAICGKSGGPGYGISVNQNIVVNGGSLIGICNDDTGWSNGIATSNGDIWINGGSVTAYSDTDAGIQLGLGDEDRMNRFLHISGGTVTTTAPDGIGTLKTIDVSGGLLKITETKNPDLNHFDCDNCIIFINGNGTVYGEYTLTEDLAIDEGKTLTISEGATLIIPDGITLTNNGTIERNGTIQGDVCCTCVYAEATCTAKPTCTKCGGIDENGEINPDNHAGGTEIRNAVPATSTANGYTGDTYCLGCDVKLSTGSVIQATGSGSGGNNKDDSADGEETSSDGSVPASSETITPVPMQAPVEQKYIVQKGDTLSKIAGMFDCTVDDIVKYNSGLIKNPNLIYVGWELTIPVGGIVNEPVTNTAGNALYVVQSGDTLYAIAKKYRCSVKDIVELNSKLIKNPNLIYTGWELVIPQ